MQIDIGIGRSGTHRRFGIEGYLHYFSGVVFQRYNDLIYSVCNVVHYVVARAVVAPHGSVCLRPCKPSVVGYYYHKLIVWPRRSRCRVSTFVVCERYVELEIWVLRQLYPWSYQPRTNISTIYVYLGFTARIQTVDIVAIVPTATGFAEFRSAEYIGSLSMILLPTIGREVVGDAVEVFFER